jgi:rubredoxin
MGYTTYTCTGCGYFYQDDFISKLMPEEPAVPSHIHSYTASAVPPTETEQGYTLYVCEVCGDSYKANYTPALGR